MIEIKCTEFQKKILSNILELSDECFLEVDACKCNDCNICIEQKIKWDIQPEPLKPCPCCGGEARYAKLEDDILVYCTVCGLKTEDYKTQKDAAESWNRRNNL